MKKLILFILISGLPFLAKAQSSFSLNESRPCGTWHPDSLIITEWQSVDTLKKPVITNERNWVESGFQYKAPSTTPAVYCPCGCGWPDRKYQYRVCSITGIRQIRWSIQNYHGEPEKSEYEKTIDKLKNKQ